MSTPLDKLGDLLSDDMHSVNAAIMAHMQSPVALIPQLASYLIAAGGKRIRPLLTLASAKIYNGDMTRAHILAAAVEFIHTATLLHDDVVDESTQRRGRDTANLVFGNQASVLVGDFLFSRAFQLMVKDGSLDVLRVLSDASAIIAQGEVMQLAAANNLKTTMDQYLQIIKAKTAALFAAACEVGPMISDETPEQAAALAAYGLNLGIAFQIADDALDYNSTREKIGKTIGDDFREGKMTAPVIYALQEANDKERDFWQRTFADKNQTDTDLQTAQAIFIKHNAMEKTMELARSYAGLAKQSLESAPQSEFKTLLLEIADYSVTRES